MCLYRLIEFITNKNQFRSMKKNKTKSMSLKEFQEQVISRIGDSIREGWIFERYIYWDFNDSGEVSIESRKEPQDDLLNRAFNCKSCTSLGWCWLAVKKGEDEDRYVMSFAFMKPDYAFKIYYIDGNSLVETELDTTYGVLFLKEQYKKSNINQT